MSLLSACDVSLYRTGVLYLAASFFAGFGGCIGALIPANKQLTSGLSWLFAFPDFAEYLLVINFDENSFSGATKVLGLLSLITDGTLEAAVQLVDRGFVICTLPLSSGCLYLGGFTTDEVFPTFLLAALPYDT
jgi:hypothetical protein